MTSCPRDPDLQNVVENIVKVCHVSFTLTKVADLGRSWNWRHCCRSEAAILQKVLQLICSVMLHSIKRQNVREHLCPHYMQKLTLTCFQFWARQPSTITRIATVKNMCGFIFVTSLVTHGFFLLFQRKLTRWIYCYWMKQLYYFDNAPQVSSTFSREYQQICFSVRDNANYLNKK